MTHPTSPTRPTTSRSRIVRPTVLLLAFVATLLVAVPAMAQGRGAGAGGLGGGPGGGLGGGLGGGPGAGGFPFPTLPSAPRGEAVGRAVDDVARVPPGLAQAAERAAAADLDPATGRRSLGLVSDDPGRGRRHRIEERLISHPEQLTLDAGGDLAVRGELLLADPPAHLLRAARDAGFRVLREQRLAELDLRWVVLATPPGATLEEARLRLRALPGAAQAVEETVAPHHLYLPGASDAAPASTSGRGAPAPAVPAAVGRADRIGLVDGGVDARHPALQDTTVVHHGCGQPRPSLHGTAVASLMVGRAPGFGGAVRARSLYAADVYCSGATGGSLEAVVGALAWMARERVPVINLSLVGPPNPLLERAVSALLARGHLLVAAVGNDGPLSPPLFPAAYPGVVGVSAVDTRRRALPEAVQGPQVAFAAPGADLAVAEPGGGFGRARGTSFAAPLVAGLLAAALPRPGVAAARGALAGLRRDARDLGAPGPDPVYGQGLVGEALRVEPAAVAARD